MFVRNKDSRNNMKITKKINQMSSDPKFKGDANLIRFFCNLKTLSKISIILNNQLIYYWTNNSNNWIFYNNKNKNKPNNNHLKIINNNNQKNV